MIKKITVFLIGIIIICTFYNTCNNIDTGYKQVINHIHKNKDYKFTLGPLPYHTNKYNNNEVKRYYNFIDILGSIKTAKYTKDNLPQQNKMSIKLFFFKYNNILDFEKLVKFVEYANRYNIMVGLAAMHKYNIDEELEVYLRLIKLGYTNTFITLQTYHSDVIDKVKTVLKHNGHIRLVKGWYKDGDVKDWKQVTENYLNIAKLLVEDKNFHIIATHDFKILETLYQTYGDKMDKMEIIFFSFAKKYVERKMKTFPYEIKNKSFYKPYGKVCLSLLYNLYNMDILRDIQRRFIGHIRY